MLLPRRLKIPSSSSTCHSGSLIHAHFSPGSVALREVEHDELARMDHPVAVLVLLGIPVPKPPMSIERMAILGLRHGAGRQAVARVGRGARRRRRGWRSPPDRWS